MVEFEKYNVKIEFTRRVVGAIPKNPEVIDAWVKARGKKAGRTPKQLEELKKMIEEQVGADEEAEKRWVGFKQDEKGIFLEDRNVKAMLRESANTLDAFRGKGAVARRQTFQHGLFVEPARIYFRRDGEIIREPDGQQERTIHVITPLGPKGHDKARRLY